jgi:hypothetical protein
MWPVMWFLQIFHTATCQSKGARESCDLNQIALTSFNIYTLKYLWITYVNPHVYFILRFCLIQNRIWNVPKFKVLIYYDLFSYSWIIYNFIVEGFILFKKKYFPWPSIFFMGEKGGCCSTTNPWVPKLHLPKICSLKSKESFFSPKIFFYILYGIWNKSFYL